MCGWFSPIMAQISSNLLQKTKNGKNGCISWNIDFQSSGVSNSESTAKNTLEKTLFQKFFFQMHNNIFLVPKIFTLFFEIDLPIFEKLFLTPRHLRKIFLEKSCFWGIFGRGFRIWHSRSLKINIWRDTAIFALLK